MSDSTTPTKSCTKCGHTLPATPEFFHRKSRPGVGLRSQCKACRVADSVANKRAHPERTREWNRTWARARRGARTPEQREAENDQARERAQRMRAADLDGCRQRDREWRAKNHDAIEEKRRLRYRDDEAYRSLILERCRATRDNATDSARAKRRDLLTRDRAWFYGNIRILKEAQGCADCGTHDGKLAHHHVDPSTKRYNVSRMVKTSLATFLDEIAKCVVLCPRCHARRHVLLRRAS